MPEAWMFSGHFDGVHTMGFASSRQDILDMLSPNGNLSLTAPDANGIELFTTSWTEDTGAQHSGLGVVCLSESTMPADEHGYEMTYRERFGNADRDTWGL